MLVNNMPRIERLPSGAGTFDNHNHHHHRHISTHLTTTITNKNDSISSTLKKRHHRSCQSSCHSSSSSQTANNNHGLKLGQKVTGSSINTLGTIRFIGTTSFKPGIWVGIELDIIGTGKNNGTVKGVSYFDCPPETGLFILANRVTPLKQSASSTSTAIKRTSTVAPKKSVTTSTAISSTTQRRRTKTPSMDSSSPNTKTLSHDPRQRCLSHYHHQQYRSITALSAAPKKTSLATSISTRTSRPQSKSQISTTTITTTGHKTSFAPSSSSTCHKTVLPATRKSVTPAIASPSAPSNIKQQQSKSTRRTVTPATNSIKKRNSSLTSSTITTKQPLQGPDTPRKSKSTSTRQVVTQDELKKIHALLEQSRQEKQRLSDEMNGKEAVWERLVTAKESYALKVQDMQKEITRLQDSLHNSQQHATQLESQLSQFKSSSSSSSSSNNSGGMPSSPHGGDASSSSDGIYGTNAMEQQYIQRIEKLERLVREWQQDAQESHQQMQQQQSTYSAQIEQLRRDLAERYQATAIMEREYEAVKQANSDTIRQYEATMVQWTTERDEAMASKDNHISRLDQMIDELKTCHFLLPPSPNNEEEEEEDVDEGGMFSVDNATGITDMNDNNGYGTTHRMATITPSIGKNDGSSNIYSSRRRLEQQLELTTIALENVQQKHKVMAVENEQLREQLSHMHAASGAADQQYRQLQRELSVEINDKRAVMEERDVALQSQLRTEDNYKDLVMTNTRLEQQLEQGQVTQEKLLVVENKLVELQRQHSLLLSQQQTQDAAMNQQQGEYYYKAETRSLDDQQQDYGWDYSRKNDIMKQQRQRPYSQSTTPVALTSGIIMPISPISETASSVITHTSSLPSRTNSRSGYNDGNNNNSSSLGDISLMAVMIKDKTHNRSSAMYCINCDLFDAHVTTDCPNQDEAY